MVPALVVVEFAFVLVLAFAFAGGNCGGFAALPFHEEGGPVAELTGASFVSTIRPMTARVREGVRAFSLGAQVGPNRFEFGDGCLRSWDDDNLLRLEKVYAVPSRWETRCVQFTRFEAWRVTLSTRLSSLAFALAEGDHPP